MMFNKFGKKICALALAAVTLLSLGAGAFAAEEEPLREFKNDEIEVYNVISETDGVITARAPVEIHLTGERDDSAGYELCFGEHIVPLDCETVILYRPGEYTISRRYSETGCTPYRIVVEGTEEYEKYTRAGAITVADAIAECYGSGTFKLVCGADAELTFAEGVERHSDGVPKIENFSVGEYVGEGLAWYSCEPGTYELVDAGSHLVRYDFIYRKDGGGMLLCEIFVTDDAERRQVVEARTDGQTIKLNGETVKPESYEIGGIPYVKLRDFAALLSGTEKQFDIAWNGDDRTILLTKGSAYTPVGGELAESSTEARVGKLNASPIYLDGEQVDVMAYTIDGNNFIRLSDLCRLLDVDLDYDWYAFEFAVNTTESEVTE